MLPDEIAIYLAGQSLGLVIGATSAGGLWSVPFPTEAGDSATCVIEYPGRPAIRAMGPALGAPLFEQAKFQVLSRDTRDRGYECRSLQQSITARLSQMAATLTTSTGGTTVYGYVEPLQPPFFLKLDESSRIYFVTNFMAYKQASP